MIVDALGVRDLPRLALLAAVEEERAIDHLPLVTGLAPDVESLTSVAAWDLDKLAVDFPRVWEHQGGTWACHVEPARRRVTLEPIDKTARKLKTPAAALVPRFRGFSVRHRQASRVVEQCKLLGFDGEIWPVHPSKDEVHGYPAYRSIADLPGSPDAAFIGVNRQLTIDVIRQLRETDCGGGVCFASGFLEADETGGLQQAELIEAAGDMPVLGFPQM